MSIRRSALALALAALAAVASPAEAGIVNVDARYYGYAESGAPVPNIGQVVTPTTDNPSGAFLEITLSAGVYKVTNAAGQSGALFDAFQFSQGTGDNWTWNFLITNATAGNKTVLFGGLNTGLHSTEAGAAGAAAGYEGYFAIVDPTATIRIMIRDNYLADNAGGVSLDISKFAVPEPTTVVMLALGALLPAGMLARRRAA